ncbi:MAG TPA: response regulator [Polyangiales bacterium]|nr:response regulator [Polyangiales bacterium]
MTATPIKIMLVDDNEADIELTKSTLEEGKVRMHIFTAMDGQDALDQLEATLKKGEELPDLILLDLNMPRLDGRGFLSKLRQTEQLKAIPVVVLTSSDAEQDIVKSYKLGANCYVNKPVGLDEFQKIVRTVEHFWLTVVKLP